MILHQKIHWKVDLKELIYDIERDNDSVEEIAREIMETTKFDIWYYDSEGIGFFRSPDKIVTFSYTLLLDLHEALNQ